MSAIVAPAVLPAVEAKPTLRGVLHHWAALVSLGAGSVLVAVTTDPRARLSAIGFAVSVCVLFTVSAAYHRISWQPAARMIMRRADHAAIFLLIAGTYTPLCLLGLPATAGDPLLAFIWIGAALGILQSFFWVTAPKPVTAAIYLGLSWALVPYFSIIRATLSSVDLFFLFGGGLCYTVGALCYATKRPNPVPGVFGYHEVFHALTLGGYFFHFLMVARIVLPAALR